LAVLENIFFDFLEGIFERFRYFFMSYSPEIMFWRKDEGFVTPVAVEEVVFKKG